MAYTKAELAEVAYIHIKGGILSSDVPVHRVDVKAYLPAAINKVMLIATRESRREAGKDRMAFSLDTHFLATYKVSIANDTERDAKYAPLEKRVQGLSGNRGLDKVTPVQGCCEFYPAKDRATACHLAREFDQATYWHEKYPDEDRIYFQNLPTVISEVLVRMMASFGDFEDNEVLPIPEGYEDDIIKLVVDFWNKDRVKEDEGVNMKDDNN